MERYASPTGVRPTAQAFDETLSKQNTELFKEKQKSKINKSNLDEDLEDHRNSIDAPTILVLILFIIGAIGAFVKQRNDERYEKMLRENKEKKSK